MSGENTENNVEKESGGAPAWMATFADMMSLLLTFFVLLLSFATMDIIKFKDALGSVQSALSAIMPSNSGFLDSGNTPIPLETLQPVPQQTQGELKDHYKTIKEKLEKYTAEKGLQDDIDIRITERGVVVRVKGALFFNAGKAKLKKEAFPFLNATIHILKEFPYHMAVEGHTDNIPIHNSLFKSNWELSSMRAVSALQYIVDKGRIDQKRISLAGFADTRPIVQNNSRKNRAKNRRIEFVYYKEDKKKGGYLNTASHRKN